MSTTTPVLARALSPKDLLALDNLADIPLVQGTAIPKLIHQSWKTTFLPSFFGTLSESWRATYPDWNWVLWTDEDNLELVKTRFPEYLELYQAFPREIYRADFARNLYMTAFGGIYADLDFDSFRPLTPVFQSYCATNPSSAFLGRLAKTAPGRESQETHSLPNAFMASVPGHPFWRFPAERAKEIWYSSDIKSDEGWSKIQDHVEGVTGPVALLQAFDEYNAQKKDGDPVVVELPHEMVYPFAWYPTVSDAHDRMPMMIDARKGFDLEAARKKYDNGIAYACTYWGSSWKGDWLEVEKEEDVTWYRKDFEP